MGQLIFVGLGLHDAKDISLKGLEAVRISAKVFAEFYTAKLTGTDLAGLEEVLGVKIRVLDRKEVEEGTTVIDAAREGEVTFLCAGDPMSATTHLDLRLRAMEAGIETRVIHGPSIFTAAASLLGLQHYKFGRTTTIPFPKEGYFPDSPYDVILENKRSGMHSLVLLDIDSEASKLMSANEAIDILLDLEQKKGKDAFTPDTLVCIVARAGSHHPVIRAGYARNLKDEDFGSPHHTIVIPGKLHFMEAEALVKLAGAPASILKEK